MPYELLSGEFFPCAAKENGGYYVAIFVSTEQAWLRTAKTGWVDEQMAAHLEALVVDGGYALNEKAMEKIDGVVTAALS